MKKLSMLLGLILITGPLLSHSVRSGEISYTHLGVSEFTFQFTVIIYSNDSAIDSIDCAWDDGTHDTLVNSNPQGGNIVSNIFTGYHTFPGIGIYVVSVEVNYLMDSIVNIQPQQQPFYTEDTLKILDPQFFGYDSSPVFLNPTIDFGLLAQVFSYNPNAYDEDGDSLSFSLVPFIVSGYSYPVASNSITVNGISGQLTWDQPVAKGNYAIAILATEWRSGLVIGTSQRGMMITINDSLTGLPEIQSGNSFSIFPNPAMNALNISAENFFKELIGAEIMNLSGKKILMQTLQPENTSLDISILPSGVYLLEIRIKDRSFQRVFVKQ